MLFWEAIITQFTFMNIAILSAFLLIVLIFLIIISGVEYAYLASNKLTIELKRKQGSYSGRLLGRFFDFPETFWNGVVISFYFLLVCFCFLFSELIDLSRGYLPPFLNDLLGRHFYIQMLLSLFIVTLIVLFSIGLVAKRSFELYPEGKLNTWSFFINFINIFTRPLAQFFIGLSEFILKYLFNVRVNKKEAIFSRINTNQFLRHNLQGHEDLDEDSKELFDKALQLTKVKVRKCMTPRNETIALNINHSIDDLKRLFVDTKLSKVVIYDHDLDNVLGYTHHLDLYRNQKSIKEILHTIPTVPETMNAIDLIQLFTKDRKSIAWVVDEFGGTAGFVTMEDVLEEIFGDINDEYDAERFTEKQISLNEFIFSGRLTLDYLNQKYKLGFPTNEAETLSGYIIDNFESIPNQKERIIISHFEFDVLRVSETRIETVKVKVLRN